MSKPYSAILVALLKGIVYNTNEKIWNELLKPENETDVKKYFADINLDVVIDRSEGFAYLKQKETKNEDTEIPRLIEKRHLTYHVSLLCLLLRKHLIENDSEDESIKNILTKDDILRMMEPFSRKTTNEANQVKQVEAAINKVIEEGFLRKMKTDDEEYKINEIIKAFINADVVKDSLVKLKSHVNQTSDFYVSLICLLLRNHLIENESEDETTKVLLTKNEIIDMIKPYSNKTTDHAYQVKQIEIALLKVIDEGFIRKVKSNDELFKINRIIKAFISGDTVKDSLDKLEKYANQTTNE